ncbi:MAG: hypothetical protein H3C48_20945, partial [Chitinophagaceae bacterium]|nr:hypothetical protein [Chitinophagaceae bacterium]
TAGANVGFGLELFGKELNDLGLSASIGSFSLFYNNYRGLGMSAGANLAFNSAMGAKGSFTAGIGLQSNSQSGITISPTFEFQYKSKFAETLGAESSGFRLNSGFSTRTGLQGLSINSVGRMKAKDDDKNTKSSGVSAISNDYSGISFAHQAYTPATNIPFTSYQFSFNLKPGTELFGNHPNLSFGGFYSRQYIAKADTTQLFPAYGYLYYQNAKSLSNALLDYNREKELMYHAHPPIPHIAIPSYTYDIYSITAEGSGGMFRPYRGDIGYMRDASVKSKSGDGSISLDLGAGNLVHAGADVRVNVATTENTLWRESNLMTPQIPFRSSDSTFEAVYFKNPAEKTINL